MSLDEEALYSIAPQVIGEQIVSHIKVKSVLDAFCGAGGLSIALAKAGKDAVSYTHLTLPTTPYV